MYCEDINVMLSTDRSIIADDHLFKSDTSSFVYIRLIVRYSATLYYNFVNESITLSMLLIYNF